MKTRFLVLAVFLVAGAGALAQERIKPKGPADFETVHAAIGEHWKGERWGKCFASARELMDLIAGRRRKAIRDALPAAPAGYTLVPSEESYAEENPMLTAYTGGLGILIEQNYQGPGKQVRVNVTADSPMAQMFQMIVQNPAMIQPNQELIKYTECSALLETQGQDVTLRFMLGDSMVEGTFSGENSDFALAMFNQQAVTKLNTVISN